MEPYTAETAIRRTIQGEPEIGSAAIVVPASAAATANSGKAIAMPVPAVGDTVSSRSADRS